MKYRLGMMVAAFALAATSAFAQAVPVLRVEGNSRVYYANAAMDSARTSVGAVMSRAAWLRADQSNCNAWTVWGNPVGMWSNQSKNNNYAGYDYDYYGIAGGLDRNFGSNLKVGVAFQVGDGEFDGVPVVGIRNNNADFLHGQGGLYGVYTFNKFFVEAGTYLLGYDYKMRGTVGGSDHQGAYGWNGMFNVGYTFNMFCDVVVTPTVGLDYIWLKNKTYSPTAGIRVRDYNDTSLQLPLEVTIAKRFATNFGSLTPFVKAGWIHEFHNNGVIADVQAASPVVNQKWYGQDTTRDLGVAGLGLNADINGRADIFATWDYTWGKRYYSNTLNFGAGINF